jgi:hypothetical protein
MESQGDTVMDEKLRVFVLGDDAEPPFDGASRIAPVSRRSAGYTTAAALGGEALRTRRPTR